MKNPFSFLLITIATLLAHATLSGAACQAAPAPTLFNVTEDAHPGGAITLQGAYLGPNCQVWAQAVSAQGQPIASSLCSLPVLNSSANIIQAQVPSDLPFNLWQVSVQDGDGSSNVKLVNQARGVCFDTAQVAPGGSFRVFGRNLSVSGAARTVVFVDGSGNSLPATVTEADSYHIKANAPAGLVPGAPYQVYVSNGLGGSQGFALVPGTLTVHAAGADPLGLRVAWASDLNLSNVYNVKTDPRLSHYAAGDGVTDDFPALNAAVAAVSNNAHGGGVVYLPAGHYYMNTATAALAVRSHVVLMGDGMGKTFLQYGKNTNPSSLGLVFPASTLCGLYNLTVQNLNVGPTPNGNVFSCNAGSNVTGKVFFKNVDYQLGRGNWFLLSNVDQLLVADCTIEGQFAPRGCLWLNGDTHLAFRNNKVTYHSGRLSLREIRGGVVEGNKFSRDGGFDTPRIAENGGIEASFSQDLVLSDNTLVVTGQPDTTHNDGETILTQNALYTDFRDAGVVASSDNESLTDTAKDWSQVTTFLTRSVVAVTSGPALGQWRYITGHTASVLTVDRPWDLAPPAGSQYIITSWSANQLFVLGNTLENNALGIHLYEGAWDCVVANNTLTNSGGIWLRAEDRTNTLPSNPAYNNPVYPREIRVNPVWDNLVAGNSVSCPTALQFALIGVSFYQIWGPLHGSGILNTEITGNTVTGSVHTQHFYSEAWGVLADGYWVLADNTPASSSALVPIADPTAVMGTTLSGNLSPNVLVTPYHFGSGCSLTALSQTGVLGMVSAN